MACPNSSKAWLDRVRSEALRINGVALVPKIAAPFGVLHTLATSEGKAISSEPVPQTCSKKNLYLLIDNFQTTHAVSGLAISSGSTGASCPCSAAEFCKRYPVARASQKFPP